MAAEADAGASNWDQPFLSGREGFVKNGDHENLDNLNNKHAWSKSESPASTIDLVSGKISLDTDHEDLAETIIQVVPRAHLPGSSVAAFLKLCCFQQTL